MDENDFEMKTEMTKINRRFAHMLNPKPKILKRHLLFETLTSKQYENYAENQHLEIKGKVRVLNRRLVHILYQNPIFLKRNFTH